MKPISELGLVPQNSLAWAREHICAICGADAEVAWGGYYGIEAEVIRCGRDIAHNRFRRRKSLTQLYKEGEAIPLSIANKIEKRLGGKRMESMKLSTMTEAKMLQRIDQAKFPQQLTPQDKKVLALVAISYGFDPLMGEVSIYQGRPYVSIDGRRRKAQETDKLDGVSTRPATKAERDDWEVGEGDYFFHADVFKTGCSHPFEGWGKVTKEQIRRAIVGAESHQKDPWFLPLVQDPQGMAEKRAEAKALRKAFHIPLPSIEDIGVEENGGTITITDVTADKATGEVVEGKASQTSPPAPSPLKGEETAPPAPTQPDKGPPPDAAKEKTRLYNEIMSILMLDRHLSRQEANAHIKEECAVDSLAKASPEQLFDILQELKKGKGGS